MSNAMLSQGVKLERGDGASPEVFTAVSEIHDWTGPKKSLKDIDVTSLDSAAKEFRPGLVDYGEVAFNGNFVASDTMQQAISADMDARTVRNWKLKLADDLTTPSQWAFQGYVKAFDVKGGTDEKISMSCTIKITGQPTFTPLS